MYVGRKPQGVRYSSAHGGATDPNSAGTNNQQI
ncbi:hypothetical protein CBM2626_B10244 [Cupriavidus taiwanensis]|nr:hypothetical protein CBM2626_B10244 [Cupriavidus taiwanensis]